VALDKYINPAYGGKTLDKITKADIQALINEHFESFAICHKIKITFKQILDVALDENLVDKNVCYNIKMPPKNKPIKRALTKEEVEAIFNADFTDQERLFVEILYYFGVRRGEALALTGEDFKGGYLTINKNLATIDGVGVISTPKTQNSFRRIPIPKQFTPPKQKGRLFLTANNELMFEARFRYFWKHIKEKIEAQLGHKTDLTCHTFRHNYCTLCYYHFSLLQTKELMGHADEKMIMEVYAHLDSEKENLKDKISNLF
jgi:integrase